jgi:very-short-patch-repair endonuclease
MGTSVSADLLAFHLKAAGIPFEREYRFHPTRRWRFDFAIPAKQVAVEVQGGVWNGGRHATGTGITGDCEKFSVAASLGWRVMPVTPAQVKSGDALHWIERALE